MTLPSGLNSILSPTASALDLLRQWRADEPVCLLHSPGANPADAGQLVMAKPRGWFIIHNDGKPETIGESPAARIDFSGADPRNADPLDMLSRVLEFSHQPAGADHDPWIVMLCYDLGRRIEPVAQHHDIAACARDDRQWPLVVMAWCPDRLIRDQSTGEWRCVGNAETIASWIDPEPAPANGFDVQPLVSSLTAEAYLDAVRRVMDAIAAGDIFQANLTQRFSAAFSGSTRELAACALSMSHPRYGAYLEMPSGRAIVSMSPELFLDVDGATRRVVTRPIKGTRAATHPGAAAELRDSVKDQAELNMIVDLMRNDLGRVCEYGSIRVTEPRVIESHPTVHHGVSTIEGTMRRGTTIAELLRAAFPGGSITGAPKIRAMQIIDEIEPVRRGPYCGSIGWIDAAGSARLNIAIRTITLSGERAPGLWGELSGTLDYGAGGGIVADSDPLSEYGESIDKAAILRMALQMQRESPAIVRT